MVGPGYYQSNGYGDTANLELADDGDTITCRPHWSSGNHVTSDILITVRDGPVLDTDSPAFTGDRTGCVRTCVHLCVCVCVCVCVRERERERERVCVCMCVYVCVSMCVCVCEREYVCVRVRV